MLIRSQDKKSLINIDMTAKIYTKKIYKLNNGEMCKAGKYRNAESYLILLDDSIAGEYSSEEKAVKVLDMIRDAYTPTPKEIQLYIDGILPKIALTNTVFQMPTDTDAR